MIAHESHAAILSHLARPERERELRREIADSLQGLVAAIDRLTRTADDRYSSCVVDDFQIGTSERQGEKWVVPLRFTASARRGGSRAGGVERIAGKAVAVIDDTECVDFRDVALVTEPADVAPDVGGGD